MKYKTPKLKIIYKSNERKWTLQCCHNNAGIYVNRKLMENLACRQFPQLQRLIEKQKIPKKSIFFKITYDGFEPTEKFEVKKIKSEEDTTF